jgi:hypothetical protein
MGLHVIIRTDSAAEGGRVRLGGVFTDEEFFKLPLVASFGAFPYGYHALHVGETGHDHDRAMAIPEHGDKAVHVLRRLEASAQKARYELRGPDGYEVFASAAKADRRAREIVALWRGRTYARPSQRRARFTAVQQIGMPPAPHTAESGKVLVQWSLRLRHQAIGCVQIKRLHARGALDYARQQERSG